MRKIAHIINPVIMKRSSDLFVAQPITFQTMKMARDFACGKNDVTLVSAQFPEDRSLVPDDFQLTRNLDRSILDMGTFQKRRKLPLMADVLDRLYQASEAEYLIYTNVDIALMPHFYVAVNQIIESGYDAFVINRRTITDRYQSIDEIPLMYAEVGEPHEGYDCFVFRRDVYPRYELGLSCIGAPWVGRILLWNLICHAENFREFKHKHLTFHIGNELSWSKDEYSDYTAFNQRELLKSLVQIGQEYDLYDRNGVLFPYLIDIKDILDLDIKKPRDFKSIIKSLLRRLVRLMNQLNDRI